MLKHSHGALLLLLSIAPTVAIAQSAPRPIPFGELLATPVAAADARIAYGPDSLQFGELRLPPGTGRAPVAVVIHGGCWLAQYPLDHAAGESAALAAAGVATWTIEYRRVGNPGGGWPGTFTDVAQAVDFVRTLAARYPRLDTTRVVLVGHSAGGHLALWSATAPVGGEAPAPPTLPLRGVVSLAGITDLTEYAGGSGSCNRAAARLVGGTAADVPTRYAAVDPTMRLPLRAPVHLVHGVLDPIVPVAGSEQFAARVRAAGGRVDVTVLPDAGHFDLVAPQATAAWAAVMRAVRSLLALP